MYRLAPESPAYNVFFAVRLAPDADISALRRALQMLISRHSSLRTIYTLRDGEPVQQILDDSQVWFEETDASAWSEDELNARLTEVAHRPFDLENGPLLRVNIFSHLADGYIFLLNIHRIATLQTVPSLLRVLLETGGLENCESLKRLFCGGLSWSKGVNIL